MSVSKHRSPRGWAVAALAVLLAAGAVSASWRNGPPPPAGGPRVATGLLRAAGRTPARSFRVVVLAADGTSHRRLARLVRGRVTRAFTLIPAVAAIATGRQIAAMAREHGLVSIVADGRVHLTESSAREFRNAQLWPYVSQATRFWASGAAGPAIAVVDSGIDTTGDDFGGRVVDQVDLTSGTGANSAGDGYGHGTLVAGIAAGEADGYTGYAPRAPIVSLDVLDDSGTGRTSDVIAAADWIAGHAAADDIRVANFSLTGSRRTSFMFDPLDRAVERLWASGVVVVAAAGNDGTGATPSGVDHAPGNDPFVITVGAADLNSTTRISDDFAAPWSSWGFTPDGFRKPELCAPGRVMQGPVPAGSTLATQHPDRVVEPGYMWMSGTSFAAPVVAGAAAFVLARHPSFTPDQVKGALMAAAGPTADPTAGACGVGEVRGWSAGWLPAPPNPNAGLDPFVTGTGFDAAAWRQAAGADASWDSAAWDSAAWDSAAWDSAAWDSAAWDSAAWDSAAWDSGSGPGGILPAGARGR